MVQRGSGQESLTAIRSPVLTGAGSCGAFLFLENGIPIRPVGFCNVNELFEVNTEQADAIEVLRGTGTALYGSNAVHGMVNVLQDAPARLPTGGWGSAPARTTTCAQASSPRATATRRAPRLKALYTHDGGWRDDSGFDEGKLNATRHAGRRRHAAIAHRPGRDDARPGDGRLHHRQGRVPRPGPEPQQPQPGGLSRRACGAADRACWSRRRRWPGTLQLRPYLRSSRMEFLQHFLLGQPLERNGQDSAGLISSVDWDLHERLSLVTGLDLEWADSFLVEDQAGPTTVRHPPDRHCTTTTASSPTSPPPTRRPSTR